MNLPGLIQKTPAPFPAANAVVSLVATYCSGGNVWNFTWASGFAWFHFLTAATIGGSSFSATNFQNCSVTGPLAELSPPPPPQAARNELSPVNAPPATSARPAKARRVIALSSLPEVVTSSSPPRLPPGPCPRRR